MKYILTQATIDQCAVYTGKVNGASHQRNFTDKVDAGDYLAATLILREAQKATKPKDNPHGVSQSEALAAQRFISYVENKLEAEEIPVRGR